MNASMLLPPWRDRLATGTLGPEYGPKTLRTYERQIARYKDWSYRKPSREARLHADELIAFMRLEDGTLRTEGIPESELLVYLLVYEQGHSIRHAARNRQLSRETVRSYLRRLKARARAVE